MLASASVFFSPAARRDRRIAAWIFAAVASLVALLGRGHFLGTDEIGVYQQTRSLWERGDLAVGPINNTFAGRDGRWFSQYGVGQSILVLPLYGTGKVAERVLPPAWRAALAGPSIGQEPSRWGGDLPMFFVGLFGALAAGALCVVFYTLARAQGAATRGAATAALFLGAGTHVLSQATTFLQHSLEATLLLSAFGLLWLDAREPCRWRRLGAGLVLGFALHVRVASAIALPALLGYAAVGWYRRGRRDPARVLREAVPLLAGFLPLVAAHFVVGWVKFGTIPPRFNNEGFTTPLWVGLSGYLLSPGMAVWIYSPLLLLTPALMAWLWRRSRPEAIAIVAVAGSYLLCFSKYTAWHGLWSAPGPRYLLAVVPLLLLPLGNWLGECGRAARVGAAALAGAGLVVQATASIVNFAYVYHAWRWPEFSPPYGFLFVPEVSPPAALFASLLSGQHVDLWILNAWSAGGRAPAIVSGASLCGLLVLALARLHVLVRPPPVDAVP
jgi:4-amino-4-deoxy-L-arabinose transferase-like glycosyltransferase